MKVAVFGSGPSGLIAAHTMVNVHRVAPADIDIISRGEKSPLFGCQYLHSPIVGLHCGDSVNVKYELVGSPELYHRKVYGEKRVSRVSPEEYGGEHKAWDIRKAYDNLWSLWQRRVLTGIVDRPTGPTMKNLFETYDYIISTIPRPIWCINEAHAFTSTDIWAVGSAPELGINVPFRTAGDNTVVCNGFHDVGWYRMSNVLGYDTIEWPGDRKPPISRVAKVSKPLATTCDCWDSKIKFVGRYGAWKKGFLAHQVYEEISGVEFE